MSTIVNGASYRCVWWWAKHFGDEKENVRTEILDSKGLASESIEDMMREMHAMALASGSRAKNFMWIADISPHPDKLVTDEQRDRMRQIIEQQRGLRGETYFMIGQEKADGRKHFHLVELRINLATGKAIPDSKDAQICHAASRQICEEFGWERTISPFDKGIDGARPKRAPRRYESYRAMKSGLALADIEAEVANLRQLSNNGREFQAALDRHGYILANGDRIVAGEPAFMIIDPAGDEHSLSRRLGIKAKDLNEFMRDVDRESLPGIRQAQDMQQERKIAALEADRETIKQEIEWEERLAQAAIEKEKIENRFIAPEDRQQPNWNRDRANQTWEDAVISAAIEQEKTARQFVAPKPEKEARGRGQENELRPPSKGTVLHIWNAMYHSDSAGAFAAALDQHAIALAAATPEEANRSHVAAAYPKAIGNFAPEYRAGEIVAVTERGQLWQLNRRTTGKERDEIEAFLAPLRDQLQGIEATKESQQQRRNEKHWPAVPPQVEPLKTSPGLHFADAARETAEPDYTKPEAFGIALKIREAHALSEKGELKFGLALEQQGIAFAAVTHEEADRSHREAEFAKAVGRRAPEFKTGEIVAVTMPRLEHHRTGEWSELPRVHKLDQGEAVKYLKALSLDRKQLQSIDATTQKLDKAFQERKAEIQSDRMDRATWMRDWAPEGGKKDNAFATTIAGLAKAGNQIIEAGFDAGANLAGAAISFFDPPTTPAQREQAAENSRNEREARAQDQIDFSKHDTDRAQHTQNHQEQQAARDRQRETERERS